MRIMTSLRPNGIIPGRALSYSLTLLLTCFSMFAQSQVPINPIVPKALYLIETEQMKKALADLEQAIGANPTDAALHYYLGYALLKANERSKALASFEKGIQINEKELINYAGKGWVSLLKRQGLLNPGTPKF